jgi:LuxR family transcriptional regulator, quorum-sensing system regulator SdiA
MVPVSAMPCEVESLLGQVRATGFDRLMYSVDMLDGEIDTPLEIMGHGFSAEYIDHYLNRLREDPLRRMVARGEIDVLTPITFENDGKSLSIARDRRMTTGDLALLRWCLSQGVRTGLSFRIRLPRGRGASLNFYSAHSLTQTELEAATQRLFLAGHQIHARLEPRLSHRYGRLLSDREAECLEWIALGKSNPEIAALLGLSLDTVKEHVQSLFQKLKVNCRAQAVSRGHMLAYLG